MRATYKVKIVINAVSAKMGGAVSYLTHLLHELPRLEGDFQFFVFLPLETAAKMEGLAPNIQLLPVAIGPAGVLRRLIWEQVTLRRFLKRQKAGVLFSTANFGMFRCPVRQLLLVRNALYFSNIYREMFLPRHSLRYRIAFALRRWLICRSVRSADVVMTPTQAMLDELRGAVEVKEAVVNPYGVAAPEQPEAVAGGARHPSEGAGNRVTRLLYVSLYGEHKNLSTLLKALALLNAKGIAQFKLQTTADPAWAGAAWTVTYREDIVLARRPGVAEHADFAGPLGREEVERLYQASDICVFPSLTESFGFPMVEAMSHGLPILAADTPVNREVCGTAAIYFSPLSAGNLADRLLMLATDSALCGRLAARGRQEAARRFSWSAHVRRIVEAACSPAPEALRGGRAVPLISGPLSATPLKVPVSVLVLTRNEEANIGACLASVTWAGEVFVVDSCSTDRTVEMSESQGAKVFTHPFEGYARQRNWAIDNLPFSHEWVLMLDADEQVPAPLAEEIRSALHDRSRNHAGYYLKRRFLFLGRWLKHGGLYPTWILRLFRHGLVRFEDRPLNEHAILDGTAGYLEQPFDHRDRKSLSAWIARHNNYAGLEAEEFFQETLAGGYGLSLQAAFCGSQAERKRWIKLHVWNRLPLLLRPFLFFLRNYFLKLGFLDGRAGLTYHILWSFWYPFLVSARIWEKQQRDPSSAGLRARPPEGRPVATMAGAAQGPRN